ncbi:MAG: DNA translocase FtsK 4TM domain-containing protein [Armatimonadota bacterium]|nr:DNA translocase FtsK 4TM domain-containing protein [Armatimonadota bacterium]
MARRRAQRQAGANRIAALGLGFVLTALLLGLSFLPGATGVPVTLAAWQRRLLGVAAPALPVYVLLTGLVLIAAGERARFTRRIAGILLASVTAVMAVHIHTAVGDMLAAGLSGRGAGLLGGVLTAGVARALGRTGLWVALAVLALAAVALLSGATVASLGAGVRLAGLALAGVVRAFVRGLAWSGEGVVRAARDVGRVMIPLLRQGVRATARGLARVTARVAALAARGLAAARAWVSPPTAHEPVPAPAGPPMDLMAPAPPARTVETPPAGPVPAGSETPEGHGSPPDAPEAVGSKPAPEPGDRRRPRRAAPKGGVDPGQERLDFAAADYRLPPQSVIGEAGPNRGKTRVDPAETARALEQTLESFGVKVKVVHWEVGPVVTRFEVQPEPGVKVQKITSLTNDIALNLAAQSVRIEAPIPGKSAVGIELPNQKASLVHLREILTSDPFQKAAGPLTVAVGKDIAGHPVVAELTEMPHLLIAGATGSGKSVALNAMIASLLFKCTPRQVRFVMIDPKRVELTDYNDIPHLLTPVVTNPRQAASVLKDMLRVMEQRFELFAKAGARNIQSYNQLTDVEPLYYIVIIIDELADLMMVAPADFEDIICRLAQMTRATGIHLLVATQRPSVDVITGLIKANIPSRLAFAVSSQVDSRTILDTTGAEKLLGRGDMLFLPIGASRAIRAQGAYIADDEIRAVVEWWRLQGSPVYDRQLVEAQQSTPTEEHADGERLIEAARLVVRSGYGSVSLLQRKMRIGYVTAARLIDELEARGIVGPVQGSNPREVLIGLDQLEQLFRRKNAS